MELARASTPCNEASLLSLTSWSTIWGMPSSSTLASRVLPAKVDTRRRETVSHGLGRHPNYSLRRTMGLSRKLLQATSTPWESPLLRRVHTTFVPAPCFCPDPCLSDYDRAESLPKNEWTCHHQRNPRGLRPCKTASGPGVPPFPGR